MFSQIISVLMNELMNDEGVCRTAPATPGLLTISKCHISSRKVNFISTKLSQQNMITDEVGKGVSRFLISSAMGGGGAD